jgi:hypothetical protein
MDTKHPRTTSLGKLAAGALVAVGLVMAAGSSAMADSWKHHNGHGNKHWKHTHHHYDDRHGGYHHYKPHRPKVVYVQPQPIYVAPPPVYYYQPAPVYRRPEINIVFPLDFD